MNRLWFLDFLRGVAVLMMVVFHSILYIDYFGLLRIDAYSGFIGRFQLMIPILFLGISGACAYLQLKRKGGKALFVKGLKLSFWALIIAFITWLMFPEAYVFFGIIHLISFCTFSAIIVGNAWVGGIIGLIILMVQGVAKSVVVGNKFLSIIGFNYPRLNTWDYYPIIPWAGVFFLGFFTGKFLEGWKAREVKNWFARMMCFIGRNALKIYLMHAPILFGFFGLLSKHV